MPRLEPAEIGRLSESERAAVEGAEKLLGFSANDALTMAKLPRVMHGLSALVAAIYAPVEDGSTLDQGLRRLVGMASSTAAGCQYCIGHTAHSALNFGVSEQQLVELEQFETSDAFSEPERAALRVAYHAGDSPNTVTDEMFAALDQHFSEAQQLEIVAVISLFGFLNRWNSTLATELESRPARVLREILQAQRANQAAG